MARPYRASPLPVAARVRLLEDTYLPSLWPPTPVTAAAWSQLSLDRLVLGVPRQQAGGRLHLTDVFQSACDGGAFSIAISGVRANTVAFAGIDISEWQPSDWVLGRAIADVVWAAREGAVSEDRFGRVFDRSGAPVPVQASQVDVAAPFAA